MNYILIFAIAYIFTFLITPTIRFIALKFSIVDSKVDERKIHKKTIARFGGMAIYMGFVFSIICAFFIRDGMTFENIFSISKIIVASTVVLCLGVYDDIKGANSKIKFTGQFLAAFLLVSMGFFIRQVNLPFYGDFFLGDWGIPLTILWLVMLTNAINLIDGLDGLAAGIVSISSIGIFVCFLVSSSDPVPKFMSIALAGSSMAFLRYNFTPAKIFMGDTGSMFLGFVIAAIAIISSHKSTTSVSLLIPILALGVPIGDTLLAFARRLLKGGNPFKADKKHIHHFLHIKKGLDVKKTVLLLLAITALLNTITIIIVLLKYKF